MNQIKILLAAFLPRGASIALDVHKLVPAIGAKVSGVLVMVQTFWDIKTAHPAKIWSIEVIPL